jgi:nucleoid-associated protein YgaU
LGPSRAASRDTWRAATAGAAGPLPQRPAMERIFGEDFSQVRVHAGRAPELDALGAHAATDGVRMAFASRDPAPSQVAHELAHVVQMRRGGGVADGSQLSTPGSAAEREADSAARLVSRGMHPAITVTAPPVLHRDMKSGDLEVPNGFFKIDMVKRIAAGGNSGETGHVHFKPKDTAPDSKRIRLSQVLEVKDLVAGSEVSWGAERPSEANRDLMKTTARRRVHNTAAGDTLASVSLLYFGSNDQAKQIGKDNKKIIEPEALADTTKPLPAGLSLQVLGAVKEGYSIDHTAGDPAAKKRGGAGDPEVLQDYVWPGEHAADNHDGHKNGADVKEAVLSDIPGASHGKKMFRFETAARSDDTGLYYGTLLWWFSVNNTVAPPTVSQEGFNVQPGVSDTFRAALTKFNKFYGNRHTVVAGQTLEQISEMYFGKTDKADAIFNANKALIGTRDAVLQPGWKLRIPGIAP